MYVCNNSILEFGQYIPVAVPSVYLVNPFLCHPTYYRSHPYNSRKAQAYYRLGRHEEAITNYDKAILLEPNNVLAYTNGGTANMELERYVEAITDLDKAISLDPNNVLAYTNRGVVNSRLGLYEEAITDYDKAISLDPNYGRAYYNRGKAYQELGNYEKASLDIAMAKELGYPPP